MAPEVKELARSAAPRAFQRIVDLVDSEDEKVALAASKEVLDRALGKPNQSVEHSGEITRYVIRAPRAEETVEAWTTKYVPKPKPTNIQ